ncbi:alpha/beta hydrolase [Couchioplanes caeruleus]|uniref:alpha/beta hydrolase n=1 Tax=Couchioplanes caeruleus TaxID=56438 RepID=UPI0020BE811B|nr:alpha/beta hydrolase [Couchioplanes caeruleus]UQU62099.1 alpha/beta hydrolase [Couchioplanes caeruleus]
MSMAQRARIDALLRRPAPSGPRPVEEIRAGFEALMAGMIVPRGVRTGPETLGGRPALVVEPDGGPRAGTILYFHGGSFVFGSPRTALSLTANLVVRTGLRAYSLDYRLAPEHPFPAAVEDAVAAYRALLDGGADPTTVVLAGDSAGGGLTVTTCLAARRAGLPMPAALVAFSPGLDATRSGASMRSRAAADPLLTGEGLERTGAMYLAGQDPRQELLSPAVCADLTGFPPMLLQVGTNELLLDDSTRIAERARAAEVDVILDVTAGVPHVFQAFAGTLVEADRALDRAGLFVAQHVRAGAAGPTGSGGASST